MHVPLWVFALLITVALVSGTYGYETHTNLMLVERPQYP